MDGAALEDEGVTDGVYEGVGVEDGAALDDEGVTDGV